MRASATEKGGGLLDKIEEALAPEATLQILKTARN